MQRDVVLRWLEEIAPVVRRLLYGPGKVDLDQAAAVVEDATARLLGPLATLVPRLDPASAAELLRDADRIYAWAQLLALQSAIQQARGAPFAESRDCALALAAEAVRRHPDPPPEWQAWIDSARGAAS